MIKWFSFLLIESTDAENPEAPSKEGEVSFESTKDDTKMPPLVTTGAIRRRSKAVVAAKGEKKLSCVMVS